MFYDYKSLTKDELSIFNDALCKYKEYDKLDLIIELIFNENTKSAIRKRGFKKIKRKEEKSLEAIPEGLKYCDGEECVISIT